MSKKQRFMQPVEILAPHAQVVHGVAQSVKAKSLKRIICLNIPDEYCYMEPALMDELKAGLSQHVELPETD